MQETEFKMDRLSLVGTNGLKAECHRQEGGKSESTERQLLPCWFALFMGYFNNKNISNLIFKHKP